MHSAMTDADDGPRDGPSARSRWTTEHARRIERGPATTMPPIAPPDPDPMAHLHIWDSWLLRDRHGEVATVDGWRIQFSLTSPSDVLPGKRHDVATIRYFYSRDGATWHDGGPVFERALGQRQWAGSALLDGEDCYLYYTAAGDDAAELTYSQRIAVAHGGTVETAEDTVRLAGPWTHEILLEPDGHHYETQAQSEGMIYTFRDPWPYEDPATGETYLLFEANRPVTDAGACGGDVARQEFNGCVGIAHSPTGDPTDWALLEPLLDSTCVNQELERPHLLRQDDRYYLFVSSHMHTFAPGIDGFDALYGFVADSLRGTYRPLNGSGLVLTNPPEAPFQSYSWVVVPHDEDVLVHSFVNYHDFEGASLDEIGALPAAQQRSRFGGAVGPVARLSISGATMRLQGLLPHWQLLTPNESFADGGYEPLEERTVEFDEGDRHGRADRTGSDYSAYR